MSSKKPDATTVFNVDNEHGCMYCAITKLKQDTDYLFISGRLTLQ